MSEHLWWLISTARASSLTLSLGFIFPSTPVSSFLVSVFTGFGSIRRLLKRFEWVQVYSVIHVASKSGVGDVSQIYGVTNPSNGDFGLENAFWNIESVVSSAGRDPWPGKCYHSSGLCFWVANPSSKAYSVLKIAGNTNCRRLR